MAEHLDFVAGTGVILELTQEEAKTLLDVTSRIGGDPATTRRRHMAQIARALISAAVNPTRAEDISKANRAIDFLTEEEVKDGNGDY